VSLGGISIATRRRCHAANRVIELLALPRTVSNHARLRGMRRGPRGPAVESAPR